MTVGLIDDGRMVTDELFTGEMIEAGVVLKKSKCGVLRVIWTYYIDW